MYLNKAPNLLSTTCQMYGGGSHVEFRKHWTFSMLFVLEHMYTIHYIINSLFFKSTYSISPPWLHFFLSRPVDWWIGFFFYGAAVIHIRMPFYLWPNYYLALLWPNFKVDWWMIDSRQHEFNVPAVARNFVITQKKVKMEMVFSAAKEEAWRKAPTVSRWKR